MVIRYHLPTSPYGEHAAPPSWVHWPGKLRFLDNKGIPYDKPAPIRARRHRKPFSLREELKRWRRSDDR